MSTWKRILTEEDGTLATSDQTIQSGESREVTLANNTTFTLKSSNVDGSFDGGALVQVFDSVSGGTQDILTLQANQTKLRVTGASNSVSGSLSFKEADDNGSHMITLAAPSSVASNVTFTLPGTDGSNGHVLTTDGSGNLSFAASSGGGSIDGSGAANRVALWSDADTLTSESGITYASATDTLLCGNLTATATNTDGDGNIVGVKGGFGQITVGVSTASSSGDFGTGTRMFSKLGSGTIQGGRVYYRNPNSQGYPWETADHTTEDKATGLLIVATDNATTDELVIDGVVKMGSNQGWSSTAPGKPLYLGSSGGGVQASPPTTSTYYSRIVGYVIDASNRLIYFSPDKSWVRIA